MKYSIEYGWLGPVARVTIGAVFSSALLGFGHFISGRRTIENIRRISQGLIGAGIVGLYVSLYAAVNLYHIIPEFSGFVGMAVVTAAAVVLSLRHGQPIAVFGVVGGLLTPALVGASEVNTIGLFAYLFLLFSSLYVVLVRKGWWGMAILVLMGAYGWVAFWVVFAFLESESSFLVLFSMALVTVVLVSTGKSVSSIKEQQSHRDIYSIHFLNISAIVGGVLILLALGSKASLGLFDWSMLGALSVALMVLSSPVRKLIRRPYGLS